MMFGDPEYYVKRVGLTDFEVAKFEGTEAPSAIYNVRLKDGHWSCDCFSGRGDHDKHANLVARWLDDGEPAEARTH